MAKIRKDLVGSVLVENPAGGDPIVLVAGDKVPDGVKLGDHVLEPKSDKTGTGPTPAAAPADGTLVVPKLVGKGSSTDDWRAYAGKATAAAGLQLAIADDAKRADIIEALKGAGIPVE